MHKEKGDTALAKQTSRSVDGQRTASVAVEPRDRRAKSRSRLYNPEKVENACLYKLETLRGI